MKTFNAHSLVALAAKNKKAVVIGNKYQYRNLSEETAVCSVSGSDKLTGQSGVLELCFSGADAQHIINKMNQDAGRFVALGVYTYPEDIHADNMEEDMREGSWFDDNITDDDDNITDDSDYDGYPSTY